MNGPTIRLLMPSAGRKVSLMRQLERYFKVYPGGLEPQASASCCLAARGRFVSLPRVDDERFRAELLDAVARIGVQVVLPVRNEDMPALESLRADLLYVGAILVQSPPDTIGTCLDKWLLHSRLYENGIDVLKTRLASDYEGILEVPLPAFVKPRTGSGSRRAQKVVTAQERDAILAANPDMIIQPFIDGQEYTADMFFSQGKLVQRVLRKRISVAGGQMDSGEVVADLDLDSYREAMRIGEIMKFQGPINMQFIEHNGICWVTDLNPRFSGGIGLSIAAGADFPAYLLELALDDEIHPKPVRIGTKAISYTDYVYG